MCSPSQGFYGNNCREPLSPAAQAVLDAVVSRQSVDTRGRIAAALRAAADQAVPIQEPRGLRASRDECLAGAIRSVIRLQILAIAAELEGGTSTSSTHLEIGDE